MKSLKEVLGRIKRRWAKSRTLIAEIELQMALEEAEKDKRILRRTRSNAEAIAFWATVILVSYVLWSVVKSH